MSTKKMSSLEKRLKLAADKLSDEKKEEAQRLIAERETRIPNELETSRIKNETHFNNQHRPLTEDHEDITELMLKEAIVTEKSLQNVQDSNFRLHKLDLKMDKKKK